MGDQSHNDSTPEELDVQETIDAQGLRCPEPVMMLHAAMRRVEVGQAVSLLATDPSTERDVGNFCRFLGHEMLVAEIAEEHFFYVIRKCGK